MLLKHVRKYFTLDYTCVLQDYNNFKYSSLLLKNSYDPLLYCELDLQSHWNTVCSLTLSSTFLISFV